MAGPILRASAAAAMFLVGLTPVLQYYRFELGSGGVTGFEVLARADVAILLMSFIAAALLASSVILGARTLLPVGTAVAALVTGALIFNAVEFTHQFTSVDLGYGAVIALLLSVAGLGAALAAQMVGEDADKRVPATDVDRGATSSKIVGATPPSVPAGSRPLSSPAAPIEPRPSLFSPSEPPATVGEPLGSGGPPTAIGSAPTPTRTGSAPVLPPDPAERSDSGVTRLGSAPGATRSGSTADLGATRTASTADLGAPPPGWYPDPAGSPRRRFWNGSDWTDELRD